MSADVLGPIFRSLANTFAATARALQGAANTLRGKIRRRLTGGTLTRFDRDWTAARSTAARIAAATKALGRVQRAIAQLGEMASAQLTNAETELLQLIDLLRALQAMENTAKHYSDLAKAYGY